MSDRERQIFETAIELSGDARSEWLAEACSGDPDLFERVSRLLAAHERASDAPSRLVTPRPVALEDPEAIDDYRILERIGEGGMGVVYLAEQTQPVRRRVALKIIKLGMDTKEVIARFESERQALALMNHPNIARILDAGATAQGRPYFVMEYVPGISITEYCDKMRLSVEQRLRLFMRVCLAVQHAHQKGVIHRDIKPSNVLVRDEQGEAVPKIIDFGVAKATERRLSELTLHTRFGFLIGTPAYMSPEQAEMTPLDVDTRSDIYSLGAVLYELLTGVRPFELDGKNQAEMQQVIRGIEPDTPSRRLTKLGAEQAGGIARRRSSTTESLRRALKGELGWITAKALAKNPARRYQGAYALARDIERFLENQPVVASPAGLLYRGRKFVRRHRAALAGASLVLFALVGGLTIASLGYVEASRERDEARIARDQAQTVTQFLADMLAAADPAGQGKDVTVREVLDKASAGIGDKFADRPLVEAQLLGSIGETYRSLGDLDAAESHLARRLEIYEENLPEDHPDRLDGQFELARVYHRQGRYAEAETLYRTTLEGRRRVLGDEHSHTVNSMNNLALVYYLEGRNEEAGELWAEALAIDRRLRGSEHPDTLSDMNNLSLAYLQTGRYADAETLLEEALEARRRVLGVEHPGTLMTGFNLAFLYSVRGRHAEAEQRLRNVAAISERVFGEEHGRTLLVHDTIGTVLHKMGRLTEAGVMLRKTLDARRRVLGEKHPQTLQSLVNLSKLLIDQRQYEEAEPLLRYAVDADSERPVSPQWRARFRAYHGICLLELGRLADAEPLLLEAHERLTRAIEGSALLFERDLEAVLRSLVDLFERLDRPAEAARYRKLLTERESSAVDRAAT